MTEENTQTSGGFALKKYAEFTKLTNSINFDRRLFHADIQVNLAYCDALFHAGILTRQESERIKNGLQIITKRAEFDRNYFDELPSKDVHSFVESRLIQLIGDTGKKLQTGKSQNDQILSAFRLYLRTEVEEISKSAANLQKVLLRIAEKNKEAILPGFAKRRKIQPILWAHWCLAYFEIFSRDLERLDEVWRRVNVLPFGSGDLAGVSFEVDREEMARFLGFEGISSNSLDSISDFDFAVEFINASTLLMIHFSRLSEDLLLYSSEEIAFISFDESLKNETSLELIKAKTGRIFGNQTAIQSNLTGLPIGSNKNLQEAQETIFDTIDTLNDCLKNLSEILLSLKFNIEKARKAASEILNSEELVNYLVNRGVSFGTAQEKVDEIVSFAKSNTKKLDELSLAEFQSFSSGFEEDVLEVFDLDQILASKNQIGGTAPETVFEALETAKYDLEIE